MAFFSRKRPPLCVYGNTDGRVQNTISLNSLFKRLATYFIFCVQNEGDENRNENPLYLCNIPPFISFDANPAPLYCAPCHFFFYNLNLLPQDEDLALGLVVGADEQPLAGLVPAEAGQAPAGAHGQGGRVAAAGVRGADDVLVARLAVGRGGGRERAVLLLGEGHLGHEVALRRLPVPAAVERDVQVRARRVEAVADGRHVRRERQARRHRLAVARRVVEGRVGRHDELRARLERRVVPEVGRLPDGEAGRVAEPVVREGGGRVTN